MIKPTKTPERLLKRRQNIEELTNDNTQLRAKLKALQAERDILRNALDKMLSDIISAQSDLEEKQDEVVRKESEISILRRKIDILSKELEAKTPQFSKMEALFLKREQEAMRKKEIEVLSLQQEIDRISAELEYKTSSPKESAEIFSLRYDHGILAAELGQKETQLREVENALSEWESGWKLKLQDLSERMKTEMEEKTEKLQIELTEHKMRREEAETRLQEFQKSQSTLQTENEKVRYAESAAAAALSQVEFERNRAETSLQQLEGFTDSHVAMSRRVDDINEAERDHQILDQLRASHNAELDEVHRMSNFWMNNSEQLSRKNKEMVATNKNLQDSLQMKNQELERQVLLIDALRAQLDNLVTAAPEEQQKD